jgi:hypothetical protein
MNFYLKKWVKLILSVYKGKYYYNKLRSEKKQLSQNFGMNHQLKLLQMQYENF